MGGLVSLPPLPTPPEDLKIPDASQKNPSMSPKTLKQTVLPSVDQKINTDETIRNSSLLFLTAPPMDNVNLVVEKKKSLLEKQDTMTPSVEMKCTFKRGICTKHKLKGEKLTIKKRAWVKKKTGLAGWSTTRTVTYICKLDGNAESVGKSDTANSIPMPNRSPELEYSRTFGD